MFAAENGINEAIRSPFDAIWWGISTLSTVGYGDVYPRTDEGRVAAMVLMILGIGLFGAITATITSFMVESDVTGERSAGDRLRELQGLYAEGLVTAAEFESRRQSLVE
ncbi:MAG: ion transporter [Chloroflexi bacterium]|nr:ion transporter [Chloroflexota bacterium]